MRRLIPAEYLTLRQSADQIAVARYCGVADTSAVKELRESGFDVTDGAAIQAAISKIWSSVDNGKLQAFVVGPRRARPLKLPAAMSKGIPGLRNPRGGDFTLLRPGNPNHHQFREWFGRNFSSVALIFPDAEIKRLARSLLQSRRRKAAAASATKAGRPRRIAEVQIIIRDVIDARKWTSTMSIKALTQAVNSRSKWLEPVSDDTVTRALDELYAKTNDRRFERVRRVKNAPARRP
jgi:hypothetical protein